MDRAQEGLVPGLERLMARPRPHRRRRRVAELLARSRYEVIPLDGRRGAGARARPARRHAHGHRLAGEGARARRSSSPSALAAHGLHGRAAPLGPPRRRPRRTSPSSSPGSRRWVCATSSSSPATPTSRPGAFEGAAALLDAIARARAPVRADRDHRLPGEPSADRRRDDDRGDVREGAATRPTSRARSASTRGHRALDRRRLGARDAAADLRRHPGRRAAREAPARLDADRDRRVAALPAQARRLRDAVPAAGRLQPRPADRGSRAGCSPTPSGRSPGSTSSRSTTSPTPRRGGSGSSPAAESRRIARERAATTS